MKWRIWTVTSLLLGVAFLGCGSPGEVEVEAPKLTPSQYSAEELVQRYVDALGGAEALAGVQTVLKRGSMTTDDFSDAPILNAIANDTGYLRRIESPSGVISLAWDGDVAWQQGAAVGSSEIVRLTERDAMLYRVVSHLAGPLEEAAAKGYTLTADGRDDEGQEVITVDIPGLGERSYYLDGTTFLVNQVAELRPSMEAGEPPMRVVTQYARYREVEGVKFAFFETTRIPDLGFKQTITWDSIEVNADLGQFDFSPPQS